MKNFLFPKELRLLGWILFVPAIIISALYYLGSCWPLDGVVEIIVNDVMIICIALGALFIVCSKESHEDEMTSALRLSALLKSLYVYIGLLIVCTLIINGLWFFYFMMINLVLFPVIYVVIFRLEMHRYNKLCTDEEQD